MRIVRAITPQMIARRRGKIVAVTSAAPLRGIPKATGYCAARGAQNAFVRAAGLELARNNIQFNANHSHTVWRDYDGDFGLDLLAARHSRDH